MSSLSTCEIVAVHLGAQKQGKKSIKPSTVLEKPNTVLGTCKTKAVKVGEKDG